MSRHKIFVFVCVLVAILGIASIVSAGIEGLTLDPVAYISPGKTTLTVSGTITCPVGQSVTGLGVVAFQQRANRQMSGSDTLVFYDPYSSAGVWACTGSPIPWSATMGPGIEIEGLWQPGPVSVQVRASVCTLVWDEWQWAMVCENGSTDSRNLDARLHVSQ